MTSPPICKSPHLCNTYSYSKGYCSNCFQLICSFHKFMKVILRCSTSWKCYFALQHSESAILHFGTPESAILHFSIAPSAMYHGSTSQIYCSNFAMLCCTAALPPKMCCTAALPKTMCCTAALLKMMCCTAELRKMLCCTAALPKVLCCNPACPKNAILDCSTSENAVLYCNTSANAVLHCYTSKCTILHCSTSDSAIRIWWRNLLPPGPSGGGQSSRILGNSPANILVRNMYYICMHNL